MKGTLYTCQCCNEQTKHARVVNSGHLLCNSCNIRLLKNGVLYFNSNSGLRIKEKKGDFYIIESFREIKIDYWESLRRVRENMEMDNQSLVGFDVHESY